jgi:hypothetical protein
MKELHSSVLAGKSAYRQFVSEKNSSMQSLGKRSRFAQVNGDGDDHANEDSNQPALSDSGSWGGGGGCTGGGGTRAACMSAFSSLNMAMDIISKQQKQHMDFQQKMWQESQAQMMDFQQKMWQESQAQMAFQMQMQMQAQNACIQQMQMQAQTAWMQQQIAWHDWKWQHQPKRLCYSVITQQGGGSNGDT